MKRFELRFSAALNSPLSAADVPSLSFCSRRISVLT